MITFTQVSKLITPRWLRLGTARAIVFAVAVHLDLMADAAIAAARRRFPLDGDREDALPLLERDRLIRRGPSETEAQHAQRLAEWYDSRRRIGNPYALLEQLRGYFAGEMFDIDVLYPAGRRIRLSSAGVLSRDTIPLNGGTTGDGSVGDNWARFVLIFNRTPADYNSDWLLVPTAWGTKGARHTSGKLTVLDPAGEARLWDYPDPRPTWNALNAAVTTWDALKNPSEIQEYGL